MAGVGGGGREGEEVGEEEEKRKRGEGGEVEWEEEGEEGEEGQEGEEEEEGWLVWRTKTGEEVVLRGEKEDLGEEGVAGGRRRGGVEGKGKREPQQRPPLQRVGIQRGEGEEVLWQE